MAGSTTKERLSVAIDPPIARITLDHPPLNVIDIPMMDDFSAALVEIEEQAHVSTIIICGTGKSFSAGVDVAAHTPDKVEQMLTKFHGLIRSLVASKKVTVAAVHGTCLGGGAELAMVCDLVFTTEDALWSFPEIKLGCYPPVACAVLAALIGHKRAIDLILTGRSISGGEAAQFGLATQAVPQARLDSSVEDCLKRLLALSPAALRVAKQAFYGWDAAHFDKGLARAEKLYLEELIKTIDAQEGIRAFMEKRTPKWLGK
ncbi:MAG TPA: enoyl-CoA hydratase/isomerase family protein [Candidatus Sulfotelmatobacter sp.]